MLPAMTNTWETAGTTQPERPTGGTLGALLTAIAGFALVPVSFLPWVEVPIGDESANAWTSLPDGFGYEGLSIAAVFVGVGIAVYAVMVVYSKANATPPTRAARLTLGILAIVASVAIFWLAIGRIAALDALFNDRLGFDLTESDESFFDPGAGTILAWVAACLMLAGGIVEIVKSRVKKTPQTWQTPPAGGWSQPPPQVAGTAPGAPAAGTVPPVAQQPPAQAAPAGDAPGSGGDDPTAAGWAAPAEAQPPGAEPTPQPAAESSQPAAWHPDPMGRYEYRYWDGAQWTANVANGGQNFQDPL